MAKLHEARKAPAKKAAAKAPAKKAAAPEKRTYTATARSGQEVFRSFAQVMTHAVDVADPQAVKPLPRAGQVWAFFSDEAKAKTWAAKKVTEGYDAVVITAEVVK